MGSSHQKFYLHSYLDASKDKWDEVFSHQKFHHTIPLYLKTFTTKKWHEMELFFATSTERLWNRPRRSHLFKYAYAIELSMHWQWNGTPQLLFTTTQALPINYTFTTCIPQVWWMVEYCRHITSKHHHFTSYLRLTRLLQHHLFKQIGPILNYVHRNGSLVLPKGKYCKSKFSKIKTMLQ